MGEAVFEAQVFAVAGGVLADEIDFADAHGEHASGFVDDAFKAAAAELTAELRDDAEGTGVIAAFGDLDIRGVARGGEDAGRQIVIQIRFGRQFLWRDAFAERGDFVELVGAEHGIHFGQIVLNVGAVALHQAAGHD